MLDILTDGNLRPYAVGAVVGAITAFLLCYVVDNELNWRNVGFTAFMTSSGLVLGMLYGVLYSNHLNTPTRVFNPAPLSTHSEPLRQQGFLRYEGIHKKPTGWNI